MRTVERTSVAAVTGSPAFMKSFIETVTPSRDATCTTMTLHAAPRIVAFPASVELAASPSQSCVEPLGTTSASSNTAGTLLIRFERGADRPTNQTRPLRRHERRRGGMSQRGGEVLSKREPDKADRHREAGGRHRE